MDNLTAAQTEDIPVSRFLSTETRRTNISMQLSHDYKNLVLTLSQLFRFEDITWNQLQNGTDRFKNNIGLENVLTRRQIWHPTNV